MTAGPEETLTAPETQRWIAAELGMRDYDVTALAGGNSNDTFAVTSADGRIVVLRKPPHDPLDPSAHNLQREARILEALRGTAVRVPPPVALCTDPEVPAAPFLVMEHIDGVAITDELPDAYGVGQATTSMGHEMIDSLAELHAAPWRDLGLEDFGRPEGFLERQVPRWRKQYERNAVRDLPRFDEVAEELERRRPATTAPTVIHGDYHLDNCLFDRQEPRLLAIIDWEMSTIGDPRLDLGIFLAFWGQRLVTDPAMPRIQRVSRDTPGPTRAQLAERYRERTGRDVADLGYFMALAFWKLAAIVEGAYALHLKGRLGSEYAQRLEHDVPALLEEAGRYLGLDSDEMAV